MSDPVPPPELGLEDDDLVESFEVLVDDETDLSGSSHRQSGFDGIGTRREARERALALLFEAEQRGMNPLSEVLDDLPVAPDEYAVKLVLGVSSHLDELDTELAELSDAWPLDRMPAIDRALLRMGAFELIHTEVPVGACISEAVELAKRYSTEDSYRFVNGMLGAVARAVAGDRPD
ncbi:MAG: transcription antitermination factor NusB [Acidimicrobiales bacterium]|nr:transcription antitermination factor NusB [Acidimicrobiales bacterium]